MKDIVYQQKVEMQDALLCSCAVFLLLKTVYKTVLKN